MSELSAEPEAEQQYDILAFYRPGKRTLPGFSQNETAKFSPTVHKLNCIGRACVYSAVEVAYATLGFKFHGFSVNAKDMQLRQFAAHLHVAGESSSWLTYPKGSSASDSKIRQLQAGLRTVPARMLLEGERIVAASSPYRPFTHEEIVQYVGALYVAPEDTEVGEAWVPLELNAIAELGRLREQEERAEVFRNLRGG